MFALCLAFIVRIYLVCVNCLMSYFGEDCRLHLLHGLLVVLRKVKGNSGLTHAARSAAICTQ